MQRADAARRAQEQETNLSDQRRGHTEAEYEMYLRKEQLRIDFVNESQAMHHNAMDELEKAIAEVSDVRNQTLQEKEAIELEIERCNEAINKFQVPTAYTMNCTLCLAPCPFIRDGARLLRFVCMCRNWTS